MRRLADGSIIISTKMETKEFDKDRNQLEQGMKRLGDVIKYLGQTVAGIDSGDAFENILQKAEDAGASISETNESIQTLETASQEAGTQGANAFSEIKKEVDQVNDSLDDMRDKQDAVRQASIEGPEEPEEPEDDPTSKRFDRLNNAMNSFSSAALDTRQTMSKAFESVRLKVHDTEIAIEAVEKKMQDIKDAAQAAGAEESDAFKKAKSEADRLNASLEDLYAKRDEMAQQKLESVTPAGMKTTDLSDGFVDKTLKGDPGLEDMDKQIAAAEAKLDKFKTKMEEAKNAGGGLTGEAEKELKSLQRKLDGLNIKLTQYKKHMGDAAQQTVKTNDAMNKTNAVTKKIEKQMGRTGSAIKQLFRRMILFAGIALIMKSVSEGIRNMAQASGSANETMSNLVISFLYLKNSIASAVMPALQALAPMITFITDCLAKLFTMIGMVMSRLFGGYSTFTKAKKAQVDYAASLGKTGKEAKKVAAALAGFDELNVLNQNEGDQDSGGAAGMPSPGEMFEEVEIPAETLAFADKLKGMLEDLKKTAQPTADAFKRLVESLDPLKEFAWTALKDFYEQFLVPMGGWVLGEGLPRSIDALREGLVNVNWGK